MTVTTLATERAKTRRRLDARQRREDDYYRRAMSPGPLCPRPFKRVFPSVEAAQTFIDLTFPEDRIIEPYRCRCGGVHIGHPIAKESQP